MPQKPAENRAPPGRVEHPTIGLEGRDADENTPGKQGDSVRLGSGVAGGVASPGDHVLHNGAPPQPDTHHANPPENPGVEAAAGAYARGRREALNAAIRLSYECECEDWDRWAVSPSLFRERLIKRLGEEPAQ